VLHCASGVDSQGMNKQCSNQAAKNDSIRKGNLGEDVRIEFVEALNGDGKG
jgi:hypothetical protein